MREIQVCRPKKRPRVSEPIRRLQFTQGGATLVATIGSALYAYDLRADKARVLYDDLADGWSAVTDEPLEMAVSPDARWVVFYWDPQGEGGNVCFTDLANRNTEPEYTSDEYVPHVGLTFTADGKELVAVRNFYNEENFPPDDEYQQDVVRFKMAA